VKESAVTPTARFVEIVVVIVTAIDLNVGITDQRSAHLSNHSFETSLFHMKSRSTRNSVPNIADQFVKSNGFPTFSYTTTVPLPELLPSLLPPLPLPDCPQFGGPP